MEGEENRGDQKDTDTVLEFLQILLYYMEQPEINRVKPMCFFSRKDYHILSALLMSVLTAKADHFFSSYVFSDFKSEICNLGYKPV